MKRYWFIFILVIGSSLLSDTEIREHLRNEVKNHFKNLLGYGTQISIDQINLDHIGEYKYRINFDDSLNIIDKLANRRFVTIKDGDEIEFQVSLTDSLDFFAVRNKIHSYPLEQYSDDHVIHIYTITILQLKAFDKIYEKNKVLEPNTESTNLEDYKAAWIQEGYTISDHYLKAFIKAYKIIKEWEEEGEITILNERHVLWSELYNQISFSFGKPMVMDGGISVLIDSVTLEAVGRSFPLKPIEYFRKAE